MIAILRSFLTLRQINLTFNDAKSVVAVTEIDILGYRISQGSISPDPERLRPLIELLIPKSSKINVVLGCLRTTPGGYVVSREK